MKFSSQKGFALLTVMVFFTALFTGFSTAANLANSNLAAGSLSLKSSQALYLGEAAAEAAKAKLRDDFSKSPTKGEGKTFSLGNGEYYFNVTTTSDPNQRRITGHGAVPSFAAAEQLRTVEVVVEGPLLFFNKALFAADYIDLSESTVTGDVFAGDSVNCESSKCKEVSGNVTEKGKSSYPLPPLDLKALKAIAKSQIWNGHDNYYSSKDVKNKKLKFSKDFYFTPPSEGNPGVPHVVFIDMGSENAIVLKDNIRKGSTVGGFIVVDSKTYPEVKFEEGISLEGVLYVDGIVTMDNGNGGMSPNGSVMADILKFTKIPVAYSGAYAKAVQPLIAEALEASMKSVSWNDKG